MATVYLVRHARPALPDRQRRFLGQTDLPLSPEGVRDAQSLAERLRQIDLQTVYCSDLVRSRDTAAILVAGRGLVPQERSWLREIDAGLWDLLTFEEARSRYPDEFARRDANLAASPFPGGESLRDVEARVVPGFLELLDERALRAEGGDILLVGHRAVNVVLLSHLLGRSLASAFTIPQDYLAVNVIETGVDDHGARWFSVRTPGP